jgi:hypothetical protein
MTGSVSGRGGGAEDSGRGAAALAGAWRAKKAET